MPKGTPAMESGRSIRAIHPPRWRTLLASGLVLFGAGAQEAAATYMGSIPLADFKQLPAYCWLAVRRYGNNQFGTLTKDEMATLGQFEKRMGCAGDFHHYCTGLWHLMDAERPKPFLPRQHILEAAVGEFQYTLTNCETANAPMKPEILTNQSRAYIGLQDYQSAVKVLTEAIRRNPQYVNAYLELSGVFVRLNNTEDARKILADGLKQAPDSRLLKLRLRRLEAKAGQAQDQGAPAKAIPPAPK